MFQTGTGAPMELPDVDLGAAWTAIAAMRAATTVAHTVSRQLAMGEAEQTEWSGVAADEYGQTKALLTKQVDRLAASCAAVAAVISQWADVTAPALTQLQDIITEAESAAARQRAQQAAGDYSDMITEVRVNDAWTQYNRVGLRYLEACREASDGLSRIRDQVPERPWDFRDNVSGFASTTWQNTVAEPAEFAWALTGDAFVDQSRWWSNLKDTAAGIIETDIQMLVNPVGTTWLLVGEELHFDAWRQQHFGESIAAAGTVWIGREPRLRAPLSQKLPYFRSNLADPADLMPRTLQETELLNQVDLRDSEHFYLGHGIRRHIIVDSFYQQDRMLYGTLLDGGVRSHHRPPRVSSWNDLDTANTWVAEALRRREPEFLAWASSNSLEPFRVTVRSTQPLGEIMTRDGNRFRIDDGYRVVAVVKKSPVGVYFETAYLQ